MQRHESALPPAGEAALQQAFAALAAGDLARSSEAYRQACGAAPGDASLPHRMALALERAGHRREALPLHFQAMQAQSTRVHRQTLARALQGVDLAGADAAVRACLVALLRADNVSPLDVVQPALSALRANPGFTGLMAAAQNPDPMALPASLREPAAQEFLVEPLWLWLLVRALQTTLPIEGLLTALRRLAFSSLGRPGMPPGLLSPALEPLAALAAQADLCSHAWLESEAETAAVAALERDWQASPSPELDPRTLVLACYRRLPSSGPAPGLPAGASPLLAEVHDRLLQAPRRRKAMAEALPCITPIAEGVSEAVRAHYEDNPYARWLGTNLTEPRPLPVILKALFPWLPEEALIDPRPLPILVAGCGAGEQPVRSACRFAGAEVLAVDLARTAIAYGQERAAALGISNVSFAQADILSLGSLEERFPLIESFGVLHHLEDPLAGWRQLRSLLAPGGYMRIALYSRRARAPLAEARRLLGADPASADYPRLRQARADLLRLAPSEEALAFVLRCTDAFDLDGLRDLLFHGQETDFTLPEIGRMLEALDLSFVGFELLDPEVRRSFRERHPDPAAESDLALWDRFEADAPETFLSMYRFWCRAKA